MTENEAKKNIIAYASIEAENFPVGMGIAFDTAIKALEEIQRYRAIGTPEECRAAVEKQTAKKPLQDSLDGLHHFPTCPSCGYGLDEEERESYCVCGQKLDWRANDENTD